MFISLVTLAPAASVAALGIGLFWSLVFGGIGGGLIALTYNALAFLARR
jgi:hypothetical protein